MNASPIYKDTSSDSTKFILVSILAEQE